MPTPPDPAALYPDIAACGSLAAALRAEAEGCLARVPVTSSDSDPLLHATVTSMLPHRDPLQISAWSHERRWSIRGTEPFQSLSLIDGRTDDLAEVARAARAWHDGEALNGIRQVAPFVHLTGRFEVPDLDSARLVESEWQSMRVEASGLDYVWQKTYQALIEAAHAELAASCPLPVHEPLGVALLNHHPPAPDRRRTVPDRGRRRHVRGGDRVHHLRPWPVRHSARGRGGGRAPYAVRPRPGHAWRMTLPDRGAVWVQPPPA